MYGAGRGGRGFGRGGGGGGGRHGEGGGRTKNVWVRPGANVTAPIASGTEAGGGTAAGYPKDDPNGSRNLQYPRPSTSTPTLNLSAAALAYQPPRASSSNTYPAFLPVGVKRKPAGADGGGGDCGDDDGDDTQATKRTRAPPLPDPAAVAAAAAAATAAAAAARARAALEAKIKAAQEDADLLRRSIEMAGKAAAARKEATDPKP